MIKLLDILNEMTDTDITWYHGSTVDINQADLDPLVRHSEKYKADTDKQKWSSTGSSSSGVGIYFGKDKEGLGPEYPMQYTGFYGNGPYTTGFMYEMKLKSDAKVVNKSDLHKISIEEYKRFIEEGIDAFTDRTELVVINPDAIQSFRKIMQWKEVPALYPLNRGKRGEVIVFDNNQKMESFLKNELGDYKLVKSSDSGKQYYWPIDDNIDKNFEYTTKRKWFNV